MKEIKWTAGNGQEVKLTNVTEVVNIADHNFTNKVDEIEVKLGNDVKIYQGLIDFENGKAIQVMGGKIRVPEELKSEVIEMIESYNARRNARKEANRKAEAEYNESYNKIKEAMGE